MESHTLSVWMDIAIFNTKLMPTQRGFYLLVRILVLSSGTSKKNSKAAFTSKGSGVGDRKQ